MLTWDEDEDDDAPTRRSTVEHRQTGTGTSRSTRPAGSGRAGADAATTDPVLLSVANPRRVRVDADGRPVTPSSQGRGRT